MKGIINPQQAIAPIVAVENSRRQSIIDDYRNLWILIHNEELPSDIEKELNESDLNTLVRKYESTRVSYIQSGLY